MDRKKLSRLLTVWWLLLALLGLNVGGTFLDLGAFNLALSLLIAGLQAVLIVAFFMYLRNAAPVIRLVAAAGFVWLFLMLGLVLSDYRTRPEDITLGRMLPESAWAAEAGTGETGARVYQVVCSACHGSGLLGAPRFGDRAAWQPHAEHGREVLVEHAVNGYKAMPPKGGHPELSADEVRQAVDYMLRHSGIDLTQ